jgi:hypothetical protein
MKVAIFGDLQACEGGERLRSDGSIPLQRWRISKFYRDLRRIVDDNGCVVVVDLGDTTDDRSSIPIPTIDVLMEGILSLRELLCWKLIGNHEQFYRSPDMHPGRLYSEVFQVVARSVSQEIGGVSCLFSSYNDNHDEIMEDIHNFLGKNKGRKKVLFGHWGVHGTAINGGTLEGGMNREYLNDNFDAVFLGHIHKPQRMDKIWIVGSPFQQNFGESGERKWVLIFDTETLEVSPVYLDDYPKYHAIPVGEFNKLKTIGEDRYKVICRSPEESQSVLDHPAGGQVTIITDYEKGNTANESVGSSALISHEEMIERWLQKTPAPHGWDVLGLKSFGAELQK